MTRAARRRGTAPLELVLVLPFLFMLIMCGWWAAAAGIVKTAATADARFAAWAKRPDTDPQRPFGVMVQTPDGSLVDAERTRKLHRRAPFRTTAPTTAESRAAVSDRTWDFEELDAGRPVTRFDKTVEPMKYHETELKQVSQFVPTVDPFIRHLATAEQLDLMKNPEFLRERIEAPIWKGRRAVALAGLLLSVPTLVQAAIQTVQMMAQFPLLIPILAAELAILVRGTVAIFQLQNDLIAPDVPSGKGRLSAREEGIRTRRLSSAQERELLRTLNDPDFGR